MADHSLYENIKTIIYEKENLNSVYRPAVIFSNSI